MELLLFYIALALLIVGIILIIEYKKRKEKEQNENTQYKKETIYSKKPIVTNTENNFRIKLEKLFDNDKYKVQSQIPLRSIIKTNDNKKYHNELFRNIDFGIFDKNTMEILVLIELNDSTHKNKDRYIRDLKVRKILEEVNIPLLTFYTDMPNKKEYLYEKISALLY